MKNNRPDLLKSLGHFSKQINAQIPLLWLSIFFLLPFIIIFSISLAHQAIASPPYEPQIKFGDSFASIMRSLSQMNFDNYFDIAKDELFIISYISSLTIAIISTSITFLLGYPIALAIARSDPKHRRLLIGLIMIPFFSSSLIRIYAWIAILKPEGLLNAFLIRLGVVDAGSPLHLFNTNYAVIIGIVYSYLPFMILPIYAALDKTDPSLIEAALDLGCTPLKAFWRVTFPISLPGVFAGCFIVLIPAIGEYVIPDLLGGPDTLMIGKQLVNQFYTNRDWPTASAVAVILLVLLLMPIIAYQKFETRRSVQGTQ